MSVVSGGSGDDYLVYHPISLSSLMLLTYSRFLATVQLSLPGLMHPVPMDASVQLSLDGY